MQLSLYSAKRVHEDYKNANMHGVSPLPYSLCCLSMWLFMFAFEHIALATLALASHWVSDLYCMQCRKFTATMLYLHGYVYSILGLHFDCYSNLRTYLAWKLIEQAMSYRSTG